MNEQVREILSIWLLGVATGVILTIVLWDMYQDLRSRSRKPKVRCSKCGKVLIETHSREEWSSDHRGVCCECMGH
jgi:hypothetical protein